MNTVISKYCNHCSMINNPGILSIFIHMSVSYADVQSLWLVWLYISSYGVDFVIKQILMCDSSDTCAISISVQNILQS